MLLLTVMVAALCLPTVHSYAMYQSEIPNGDNVPHPCKVNFVWHGVGHENPLGGGVRNPFGLNFAANGNVWNTALCRKDSDGDGRTNGEELGDPNCAWTKGQAPPITTGITHPGVCEPMDSDRCANTNDWVDCSYKGFDCDAINEPEVRNITLRFPRTKVPAKVTTYICFNFELPDDQEYHMIATRPAIDNKNVMHHLILLGCYDSVELLNEPEECNMGACGEMMALWTVGLPGQCHPSQVGFLIGKGRTRMVSMQLHWNNPTEVDTWYDASGLTIYYTPKLRPNNAGNLLIGQSYLDIPPGMPSWVAEGRCTSECTNTIFTGDIHVFASLNHMHYLGIRQNVTLIRSGGQSQVISDDNPYSYDSPKTHKYEPTLTISPGDELLTYCTYQSLSRTNTTLQGDGTFDEMCYAFLLYYPAENIATRGSCYQYKDVDLCFKHYKCDLSIFNTSLPHTASIIRKVLENCDATGLNCHSGCPAVVNEVVQEYPCTKKPWNHFLDVVNRLNYNWDPQIMTFVNAMKSCHGDGEDRTTMKPSHQLTTERKPITATAQATGPGSWLLNMIKAIGDRPLLQNIIMNVNYFTRTDRQDNDDLN